MHGGCLDFQKDHLLNLNFQNLDLLFHSHLYPSSDLHLPDRDFHLDLHFDFLEQMLSLDCYPIKSIANTELTGIDTSKLVDKMHDNIFLFFMISLSYPQLYIKIDQSHLNKKGRSYSHYIIYAFFNTKQRCRLMVTLPSVMF